MLMTDLTGWVEVCERLLAGEVWAPHLAPHNGVTSYCVHKVVRLLIVNVEELGCLIG